MRISAYSTPPRGPDAYSGFNRFNPKPLPTKKPVKKGKKGTKKVASKKKATSKGK